MGIKHTFQSAVADGPDSTMVQPSDWNADHECTDGATLGKVRLTAEGGVAIALVNGTGSATVKGTLVACSPTEDNKFVLQSNEFDTIGVVYEAGVANGSEAWVVVSGVAEVLMKDSNASTHGYVVIAADTDGRAIAIAVPTSTPGADQHWKECGHFLESKTAGTNVLAKAVLHFN